MYLDKGAVPEGVGTPDNPLRRVATAWGSANKVFVYESGFVMVVTEQTVIAYATLEEFQGQVERVIDWRPTALYHFLDVPFKLALRSGLCRSW